MSACWVLIKVCTLQVLSNYSRYNSCCSITDLIVDELSDKLMIGVNEFTLAISSSILPHSNIARPSVSVGVRAKTMSNMCFPLSVIYVTIHVIELAITAALIICPATCNKINMSLCDRTSWVEVDSTAIKRKFNSTCKLSSVFQCCGSVSEIVRLQLVKSFCLPMLTHCIGALILSKQA